MKKKYFILGFITIVLFMFIFLNYCNKKEKYSCMDCNIILVSIDTLRADHLGCYGYIRNTSPNIDKFSKDSVLFERCVSSAPSTMPSFATLFTSLIPSHHGAYFTKTQYLSKKITTIAEILKKEGYKTASFNEGGQISSRFGFNQGFDLYDDNTNGLKPDKLKFERIVKKAIEWLKKNHEKKYFMFLHTYETHHPYTPDRKILKKFEKKYDGKLPIDISVELINRINKGKINMRVEKNKIDINKEDGQHIINAYDSEIRSMDESFGKLIAFLKKNNLYNNTIIIFHSDHGEEFGEHGVWATHSYSLYNELLHVPLIIKFKKSKFSTKRIKELVGLIDVPVTLLGILKIRKPELFEGEDFMGMVLGFKKRREKLLMAQRDSAKEITSGENWTIMDRTWKLYNGKLFDLKNDPLEQKDVSTSFMDKKILLRGKALSVLKKYFKIEPVEKRTIDKDLKKKLKSLGYI